MPNQHETNLIEVIKQQDWLMAALRDVRDLNLPDWYIGAGAIRNTVWNYYHNKPTDAHLQDIDVVYFDPSDMKGEGEELAEKSLNVKQPNLDWEVVNQARAHLFKESARKSRPAAKSSCEAIGYWIEIPTCTGVRLNSDDSFTICSPHGLEDLMNLVVKPIPKPHQNLLLFKQRVEKKKWANLWPNLKIHFSN